MQDGVPKIVSVVSAMAEVDGRKIAIGTSLQEPLNVLLTAFTQVPRVGSGMIQGGQRQDTGAKFLRP